MTPREAPRRAKAELYTPTEQLLLQRYDDVPPLAPGVDVAVSFGDLFKGIAVGWLSEAKPNVFWRS
jgi:hypothetical protein